jgi:tetratricopeptide (TPR) repeat protein
MKALFAVLLLGCATACGAKPAASPEPRTAHDGQNEVEVPRTVITPQGASSVPELLQEAAALAKAERWAEAAAAYDRVYRLEPEKRLGDQAVWGAADAYDRANNLEAAVARFELYAGREPESDLATAALVRATRIHVFRARFQAAGVHADRLLKKLDALTPLAKISVYGAKALSLLDRGESEQASYFIEKGRNIVDAEQLDRAVPLDRDLAQLFYALGELRRLRAAQIKFEPLPPNFTALLEQRCQLLLDAQTAYSDTMRAGDGHWSAMAGYRVAELYQDLHRDLMAVRPPPSAGTERERQLWEGAVRTRYAILLSKAKTMAEHTLAMATRVGEQSVWVDKTRQAIKDIDQAVSEKKSLLEKLNYTQANYDQYIAEQEALPQGKPKPKAPAPKASGVAPKGSGSGKP